VSAEDLAAITSLVTEWAWLLDHDRWHEIAELMTDDGVVVGLGPDRHGPDGMRAWADARAAKTGRRTLHQLTNLRATDGPDGVLVTTALVLRAVDAGSPDPRVEFVGEYRDRCVPTDAGWRFARRELVALG
jgi:ketosteroid isomerase-like protein